MKRVLTAVLLTITGASLTGSEVVVFDSGRSLVVQSHRKNGEWIHLRMGSGEIAVRAESVIKIANEGAVVQPESSAPGSQPAETAVTPPPPPDSSGKRRDVPADGAAARAEAPAPEKKRPPETAATRIGTGVPMGSKATGRGARYAPLALQGGNLQMGTAAQRRQPAPPRPVAPEDANPPGE